MLLPFVLQEPFAFNAAVVVTQATHHQVVQHLPLTNNNNKDQTRHQDRAHSVTVLKRALLRHRRDRGGLGNPCVCLYRCG